MKAVYLESEQFRSDSLIPATECNKSSDFMRETKKNEHSHLLHQGDQSILFKGNIGG